MLHVCGGRGRFRIGAVERENYTHVGGMGAIACTWVRDTCITAHRGMARVCRNRGREGFLIVVRSSNTINNVPTVRCLCHSSLEAESRTTQTHCTPAGRVERRKQVRRPVPVGISLPLMSS